MVRLTDRPDMTFDVYRGRKITIQQQLERIKQDMISLSSNTLTQAVNNTLPVIHKTCRSKIFRIG